jgi:hypothetical protein
MRYVRAALEFGGCVPRDGAHRGSHSSSRSVKPRVMERAAGNV